MIRVLRQCFTPVRARDALLGQHLKRMYSPFSTKVIVPRTDSDGKMSSKLMFENSVAKFGRAEEEGLRIRIIDKESFSDAMGIGETKELPPSSVTDLYRDDIGPDQILDYDPCLYPEMSDEALLFFDRMHDVARNNEKGTGESRRVLYIDEMAAELMRAVNCYDRMSIIMVKCSRNLYMGKEEFAAKADREGRRGKGIVWLLQKYTHVKDQRYKKGDIQLVARMIAAYQANVKLKGDVYPERMMGVKIKGDRVYFYSMRMTASYLESLELGAPCEDIEVLKYPVEDCKSPKHSDKPGLRISVPEERRQILDHLWSMRCYAVGLKMIKR